jgi:hypothetical protein
LNNGQGLPFLGLPAAAVGLIVTVILIYAIWRLSSGVTHPAEQEPVKYSSWKWDYLPLIGVGLIYLGVSGWTAIASLFTGQITLAQAGYDKVQISQTIENRFRIADQGGNDVGQMVCTITPVDSKIRLDCTSQVRAYEVNTSFGFFKDGDHHAAWSVTWDSNTMNLLDFSYERAYADAAANVRAIVKDGRLVVETAAAIQELAVSPDTLMEYEWAWRVNALRPQVFTSIQSSFCYLLQWNEQAGKSSPMLKTKILRLTASDWIDLPAARVKASKASLGSQVAWYAKDYTGPARFEDGMLIYEQVK